MLSWTWHPINFLMLLMSFKFSYRIILRFFLQTYRHPSRHGVFSFHSEPYISRTCRILHVIFTIVLCWKVVSDGLEFLFLSGQTDPKQQICDDLQPPIFQFLNWNNLTVYWYSSVCQIKRTMWLFPVRWKASQILPLNTSATVYSPQNE